MTVRIAFFLLSLSLTSLPLSGQIVLLRDHLPRPGNSVVRQPLDSVYLAGLDLEQSGGGQRWDFSAPVSDGRPDTLLYLDPAATAFAGAFPGATLAATPDAADPGAGVAYFFADEQVFASLGFADTVVLRRNLAPEQLLTFPFSTASAIEQSVDFFLDAGIFRDTGEINHRDRVDAWGEIITPLGRFECLRLKRERTEEFLIFGLPVRIVNTIYEFWTREYIVPVLTIDSQRSELFGDFDNSLTGNYLLEQDITVSADRPPFDDYAFALFPNPSSGHCVATFRLPARLPLTLTIYDQLGRPYRRLALGMRPAGIHEEVLDLTGLPPGVYRVVLSAGPRRLGGATLVRR